MRFPAAASSALRLVLAGPARPAECLGVTRGALYLKTTEPPGVLVLLCQDSVRLPCGLLLPATSAEFPLTSLTPPSPAPPAAFVVGDGAVSWTGPAGLVLVRVVREWAPARPAPGEVSASALAAVRAALGGLGEPVPGVRPRRLSDGCLVTIARAVVNVHPWSGGGVDPSVNVRLMPLLARAAGDHDASVAAAAHLLGRGPGLTPGGDDVLAGFLIGAAAFGLDVAALRYAVAVLAPARTTALSAALLWHATRGECIDELAAVAAVLTSRPPRGASSAIPAPAPRPFESERAGRAVSRLLSVGHSSGAAMALGLVLAAEAALHRQERRAA
jgi:hypothetical protein